MIAVVAGMSAVGKTSWLRHYHEGSAVWECQAMGEEPSYSDSAQDAAEFWADVNARRWREAVALEARTGLAACDTDPLKLRPLARERSPWIRKCHRVICSCSLRPHLEGPGGINVQHRSRIATTIPRDPGTIDVPSRQMRAWRLSVVGALALVIVACGTGTNGHAAAGPVGTLLEQCPTVVDTDGQGSLTVSVSNATLVDSDPMVVAVAVDGSTVLCKAVLGSEPDTYTDFTVPVSRERHSVSVDVWANADLEEGFSLRSFSTSRDVDPVETPFVVVERRHAPPEGAIISVEVADRLP